MYVQAALPTPILNTEYFSDVFGGVGETLPFDEQGLVRELESIAFPKTIFKILDQPSRTIFQISTSVYPTKSPIYIDSRFVVPLLKKKDLQVSFCPKLETILSNLLGMKGITYIWGGNYSKGIKQMLEFYPPKKKLSEFEMKSWTFQGVDCSGILYEATEGYLPRNASWIAKFGFCPMISAKEIFSHLLPLDTFVYRPEKGGYHVFIALDKKFSIESLGGKGVIVRDLKDRVNEISETRKFFPNWDLCAEGYTIRRWHPMFSCKQ